VTDSDRKRFEEIRREYRPQLNPDHAQSTQEAIEWLIEMVGRLDEGLVLVVDGYDKLTRGLEQQVEGLRSEVERLTARRDNLAAIMVRVGMTEGDSID